MPYVTVGTENSPEIDSLRGPRQRAPVVLIHGYPLNGNSWERQERALLAAGYRVITYDRRGFGRSSQPTDRLRLRHVHGRPQGAARPPRADDIVLAGFSMGTGEVTRYLGTYGSARVRKAALFGAIPPFLLKTDDNPEGRRRGRLRGHQGGDREGPLRLLQGLPRQLLQRRQARARADRRAGVAGELQRRRGGFAVRDLRLRRHVAD